MYANHAITGRSGYLYWKWIVDIRVVEGGSAPKQGKWRFFYLLKSVNINNWSNLPPPTLHRLAIHNDQSIDINSLYTSYRQVCDLFSSCPPLPNLAYKEILIEVGTHF